MYDFQNFLLTKEAAFQLKKVKDELRSIGLGLKIWDGFRPMSAQWKFWEILPDERYVSDPRKGGRHTLGTVVDVTLVNILAEELLMPSSTLDDFSEKAHRSFMNCSEIAIKHRQILEHTMEKYGFIGLPTECWRFDLENWQNYLPIED